MLVTGCASAPVVYHDGETQCGLASWYGSENGHATASGERFNPHVLTAAHRHLPFGTIVRVTNEDNGRSVEVRINDRGPYAGDDRIIDVSSSAADILQMKQAGIVRVEIEVLRLGGEGARCQHAVMLRGSVANIAMSTILSYEQVEGTSGSLDGLVFDL
jgi:rare lipoprotein A